MRPEDIVKELNAVLCPSRADPITIKKLDAACYCPIPSSPAKMGALHCKNNELFGEFMQEAGIKPRR